MRVLVTGGGGFLGSAIVRRLVERGDEVVSYSRSAYPALERLGVRCARGDLADPAGHLALAREMRGVELVLHVAAKAGVWGPRDEYERANVLGTRRVVEAAREAGVARLVATSSPSVCFDGADHELAGPDLPHARRFLGDYARTKAEAERIVLAANGPSLATCALRPHLVFGPGDPHLLPRVVARARAGRLAVVGSGTNRVSLTYVDNAAAAHLDAADRLAPGAPHAGRAYFVSQEEPVALWPWIARVLAALGVEPPRRRVPLGLAYAAGGACEALWRALRLSGEPPMTRFVALHLARSHSFDLGPARRDFGYVERVGLEEATSRTIEHLRASGA